MGNTVSFRNFELRDVDFVYKAKNDNRVNETIVGDCKKFSYEDAVKWVNGCINPSNDYKYWAVCTNDEFENIIGWCGISNIDSVNHSAYFRTMVIYHPKYRDTIAWYETWNYVLDYVFNNLNFNRIYATCVETNKFHTFSFKLFPECFEGVLKQALFKNGQYVDVSVYGISKTQYELYKREGLLELSSIQARMKKLISDEQNGTTNMNDFIANIRKLLDVSEATSITPDTNFRDLDEWSSLFALEIITIVEKLSNNKYSTLNLKQCKTFRDIYENFINEKKLN